MMFELDGKTGFGDGGVSPLDAQARALMNSDPSWTRAGRMPEGSTGAETDSESATANPDLTSTIGATAIVEAEGTVGNMRNPHRRSQEIGPDNFYGRGGPLI